MSDVQVFGRFFTGFFVAGTSIGGRLKSVLRSMPKIAERSAPAKSPEVVERSVIAALLAFDSSSA